jgi:hypothetical protein
MRGRDHQGLTNMSEDIDTTLSEEQKAAVRYLICGNAVDVADAEELMMMVGVHPNQPDDDDYLTTYAEMPNSGGKGFTRHTPPRRLQPLS